MRPKAELDQPMSKGLRSDVLITGDFGNGLEATSFGDCGLFGLFPGNRIHGILGVLQHYRHLADLGLLGPRD